MRERLEATRASHQFPETGEGGRFSVKNDSLKKELRKIVGNKWSFDNFAPMEAIPTAVSLTTYAGEAEEFMRMPVEELLQQIAMGKLLVQAGKTFRLDEIVEAHRCMEENKAGGKIVVLT